MARLMTKVGSIIAVYAILAPDSGINRNADLRSAPLVSVMQPAQHRRRDDPARLRRLDRSGLGSILI